jgi:proline dehydrogenase
MDAQVTTLVRDEIAQMYLAPEPEVMQSLVAEATAATQEVDREAVRLEAIDWVERCRKKSDRAGTLDAFLQEFGLSNQEGIALMCLAESLLRVPDAETADRLIAEKIHEGDWVSHRGKSRSGLVNASVWGLMLTGKIVSLDDDMAEEPASWMRRLVTRMGEPVVRGAVQQAMRIMGGQFVLGRTISEAMQRARKETHAGDRYAFDMLGEGARTMADAEAYEAAYAAAINEIIRRRGDGDVFSADSISVKLSALHPRYQFSQQDRVFSELYPRLKKLALQAKQGRIGLSIDAEECERLELSLDLFEKLARDPELEDWDGLGFVLQAYQKKVRRRGALAGCAGRGDGATFDGASGQRRLLGFGGKTRSGEGARGLSGIHSQDAQRRVLRNVCPHSPGFTRSGIPTVRDPQRLYHCYGTSTCRQRIPLRIPAFARHGSSAVRRDHDPASGDARAGLCTGWQSP